MLFQRQRILLGLLKELGGNVLQTDFQKLLFKYVAEEEEVPSYDFVPYKYGCFSFTSYSDKRKLIEKGFLEDVEGRWVLSKSVDLPEKPRRYIKAFAYRNRDLRGDELIRDVYRKYPEVAWRSEILDRILPDELDRKRVEVARPNGNGPGVVTIGYEGKTLEAYLNSLLNDGVSLLCDVRRNPLSRKYGFSKRALAHGCEGVGIKYEHLPELGIPGEQRRELNSQADYDALFEDYERSALPKQTRAIGKIADWVRKGERVALTCYELHPQQCHRHCVAEAVEEELAGLVDLVHL